MKVSKGMHTQPNIWDQAKKLDMPEIDPGVRFFVFVLNSIGFPTEYSCAGHPSGFYVIFNGNYTAALKVKRLGYLNVEVEGNRRWSIRISTPESRKHHVDHLRYAASAWARSLAPKRVIDFIESL